MGGPVEWDEAQLIHLAAGARQVEPDGAAARHARRERRRGGAVVRVGGAVGAARLHADVLGRGVGQPHRVGNSAREGRQPHRRPGLRGRERHELRQPLVLGAVLGAALLEGGVVDRLQHALERQEPAAARANGDHRALHEEGLDPAHEPLVANRRPEVARLLGHLERPVDDSPEQLPVDQHFPVERGGGGLGLGIGQDEGQGQGQGETRE
eukprot:scaffold44808_cov31-Phaeocystis_antarctica.AAC.1